MDEHKSLAKNFTQFYFTKKLFNKNYKFNFTN